MLICFNKRGSITDMFPYVTFDRKIFGGFYLTAMPSSQLLLKAWYCCQKFEKETSRKNCSDEEESMLIVGICVV